MFPVSMGHFSFASLVALILLYLLVLFPIFLRECIFGFTTSYLSFVFLYFFFFSLSLIYFLF